MRRVRSGLSLLELQVAFVILFLVAVFIMALFTSGLTSFQKSKSFTTAIFLAREKMEKILYQDQVSPSAGNFPGAFKDYAYQVSVRPYDSQLDLVSVNVTGPGGASARLQSLGRTPLAFYGVAADQFSSTNNLSNKQKIRVDYTEGAFPPGTFSTLGSLPNGGNPSGNAVDIFASVNWTGDQGNNTIAYYNGVSWSGITKPPGMGTPAGMATDEYANVAYVADKTDQCLWKYNSLTEKWKQILVSSLGVPAGIATDHFANIVWIADTTNNCLRLYNDHTATTDPTLYEPAPDGSNCGGCGGKTLASPRGVATTEYGDIVYVIDSGKVLWEYNANTGIWSVVSDQSSNGSMQSVSGLSTDSLGNTTWMNDAQGHRLWFYDGSTWYSNAY